MEGLRGGGGAAVGALTALQEPQGSHKGATGKPQGPPGTKEAKNSACIHCSARDTRTLEPLTATSGLGCLYSLVGILPGC